MKKIIFLITVVFCSLQYSCSPAEDDVNFHFSSLQVESVELPEDFNFGEVYEIKVTFIRPNSCTYFKGFDIYDTATTERNVVVVGSVLDDVICTEKIEMVESSFNFEVIYTKDYLFRFWTGKDEGGNDEFLEIAVPINKNSLKN